MRKPPTLRSTQSLCVSATELATIQAAAKVHAISVSSFGYSRVMAALASKATRLGALRDLKTLEAGPVTAKGRKSRASIIMAAPDYCALKSVAEHAGVSAHALTQAIVICDAERTLSQSGPARMVERGGPGEADLAPVRPVSVVPINYALVPDAAELALSVTRMADALQPALWPDRGARVPSIAADYDRLVAARLHVRHGMLRVLSNHPRDVDRDQNVAIPLDPRDVEWMAAALAMPPSEVARAIALRCLLDIRKAARQALAAAELDQVVADALRPIEG